MSRLIKNALAGVRDPGAYDVGNRHPGTLGLEFERGLPLLTDVSAVQGGAHGAASDSACEVRRAMHYPH